MTTVKAHRFPVSVHWVGGRLTRAAAPEKPELQVATPPEFRDGIAGVWSPEELLVTATASCYAVTLVSVAEQRSVPLRRLDVRGVGHVTRRDDGRFGFVAIELAVEIDTDPGFEAAAEKAAELAERYCLVRMALEVPVHVEAEIRVAEPLVATA